ncbi:unnamed protein product [Caenorhabditis bovis]|uniref:Uncharacterized protein n=1 Tax=Caenorhabditis bovis TaxID=2654633 RepID=A0A8S1EN00_9PELO|nr:unnamed protein product [Caenorhabditis bovis]
MDVQCINNDQDWKLIVDQCHCEAKNELSWQQQIFGNNSPILMEDSSMNLMNGVPLLEPAEEPEDNIIASIDVNNFDEQNTEQHHSNNQIGQIMDFNNHNYNIITDRDNIDYHCEIIGTEQPSDNNLNDAKLKRKEKKKTFKKLAKKCNEQDRIRNRTNAQNFVKAKNNSVRIMEKYLHESEKYIQMCQENQLLPFNIDYCIEKSTNVLIEIKDILKKKLKYEIKFNNSQCEQIEMTNVCKMNNAKLEEYEKEMKQLRDSRKDRTSKLNTVSCLYRDKF